MYFITWVHTLCGACEKLANDFGFVNGIYLVGTTACKTTAFRVKIMTV